MARLSFEWLLTHTVHEGDGLTGNRWYRAYAWSPYVVLASRLISKLVSEVQITEDRMWSVVLEHGASRLVAMYILYVHTAFIR